MLSSIIAPLKDMQHGFKPVMVAGDQIMANKSLEPFKIAISLLSSGAYQERSLAVYLLGQLSASHPQALEILEKLVVDDPSWQVQEMLAKALDQYCATKGYKTALPEIKSWIKAKHPALNRAVVEGLRIWTSRSYFKEHPEAAVTLINSLVPKLAKKDNIYLTRSVGNSLRDIKKKYPELISSVVKDWEPTDTAVKLVYKLLNK
jgi:3-methyladenine DNA glycosylase AlkC